MATRRRGPRTQDTRPLGLSSLPTEVVLHVLSFLSSADDLCNVSLVSRALTDVSADDALWQPLGHSSWRHEEGWKKAYMSWLRQAAKQYRERNDRGLFDRDTKGRKEFDGWAKVVFEGYTGSGRTSLIRRYMRDQFTSVYKATIGVDFEEKLVTWNSETIMLQLWDVAGPERFSTRFYTRGAHAVFIVYAINSRRSFEEAATYLGELAPGNSLAGAKAILVANKTDFRPEYHEVSSEEGSRLASAYGVPLVACSAKTGDSVEALFVTVLGLLSGDWTTVAGMAGPRHVPSEQALAKRGIISYRRREQATTTPRIEEKKQTPCLLQ